MLCSPHRLSCDDVMNETTNKENLWGIIQNFTFVESMKDVVVRVEYQGRSFLWVCADDSLFRHWFYQLLLVPKSWGT